MWPCGACTFDNSDAATTGGPTGATTRRSAASAVTETKTTPATSLPIAPSDTCVLCSGSGFVTCDMSTCRRCGCDVTSGCYKYCRGCALEEKKCSTCGNDYKTPRQYLELFVARETTNFQGRAKLYAKGGVLGASREKGEKAIHRLQRSHNRACEAAHIFFDNDDGADQTPFMAARLRRHLALPDPDPIV